jgi:glycosyltransferase involved in cell wall biosynthesis
MKPERELGIERRAIASPGLSVPSNSDVAGLPMGGIADSSVGILALVPDSWNHIVMPRHQVLKRLARHFRIVWVEPAAGWRDHWLPSGERFLKRAGWRSPVPGLEIMTPGSLHPEFVRLGWLRTLMFRSRLAAARRRLVAHGAQWIVLYIWRDEFADAIDLVDHDMSCYHVDDEYTFAERDVPNSAREVRLLNRVDQVIIHSPGLLAKKGGMNPHTAWVPNGVDYRSFASPQTALPDLEAIPRPRIGYAGVIKKQLDLGLLVRLARARPKYSFVLVGPVMNVAGKELQVDQLRRLQNVHFLGEKSPESLPAYVQHFDVCLMCYEMNDYTKYIFPLKLNEYLAAGRPTVSSPINSVAGLDSVVTLARTDAQWLDAIDRSLEASSCTVEAIENRRAFALKHDWDALVDVIACRIRGAITRAVRRDVPPPT